MSKRTADGCRRVRSMIELKNAVQEYLEKLKWIHPPQRSELFEKNAYEKWACMELLREIERVDDIPFHLTAYELLFWFSEKMKNYACEHENKDRSIRFVYASELAEYFIDEYMI